MIGNSIRNLKRWNQVLAVLVRHGFAGTLQQIGLSDLVSRVLKLTSLTRSEGELIDLPTAQRLRLAMEELGPTYIKIGQVLSTRRDIVPDDWATEFEKLQSDCPRVPFDEIQKVLNASFPGTLDTLFKSIDETPLAAASMAQAHAAVLNDGTDVVLKILRPGIRETIGGDMEILRFLAKLADEHLGNLGFNPVDTVNEFARELERETDLTNEGRATERLARMFEDDENIGFATIYWNATTKDVVCQSRVRGHLLASTPPSEINHHDRKALVKNGARAVFHQTLGVGFFHADPHPGNIFVQAGGRVVFIDCGMTGFVDESMRMHLAELVYGVTKNDADMVMRAAVSIADVDPDTADLRGARADVQELVARFVGVPLDRIDLADVLDDFFQTLRRHDLRCPPDIVLLIKAMSTIEGVATAYDPDFDMVSFTRPYVEKLLKSRFSPQAIAKQAKETALAFLGLVRDTPHELTSLFRRIRTNRLRVQMDVIGIEDLNTTIEAASEKLSFAVQIASLVMASSVLVLASRGEGFVFHLGLAGFVISGSFATALMVSAWRQRRKMSRRARLMRRARGEE